MFGMVMDTIPKYYMVPSPSLYMTLRSRSQNWNFYIKVLRYFYYVSFCKAFDGFDSCLA